MKTWHTLFPGNMVVKHTSKEVYRQIIKISGDIYKQFKIDKQRPAEKILIKITKSISGMIIKPNITMFQKHSFRRCSSKYVFLKISPI